MRAGDTKSHDWSWWGGNSGSGCHRNPHQYQELDEHTWEDQVHRRPPFHLLPKRPQDWTASLSRKSCWSKIMMTKTYMPMCDVSFCKKLVQYETDCDKSYSKNHPFRWSAIKKFRPYHGYMFGCPVNRTFERANPTLLKKYLFSFSESEGLSNDQTTP